MERSDRGDRNDKFGRGDRGDRGGMMDRGGDDSDRGESEGGGRKGVRSKYRAEYPGDFKFDYKDPVTMGRFVSEMGKITPSRISKLSRPQQSKVANAVKKARNLGLLAIGTDAYDTAGRPEQISAKPFSID